MIQFTQDSLADYFTLAGPENSWLPEPTNIYDFIDRGSQDLLITVGDSWTHGSSIVPNSLQSPARRAQVFGNLLSYRLGTDWLNLAIPAQGNFWIARTVGQIGATVQDLAYKKILLICTLTGVTRWFNTWLDQDIDYIKWFQDHVQCMEDFDKLLVMLNERCVDDIIAAVGPHDKIILLVGTNFVEGIGLDRLPARNLLPIPWYQIMGLRDIGPVYTCLTYSRLEQAIDFLPKNMHGHFKSWMLQLMAVSSRRIEVLQNHPDFRDCHPLAAGHQAWADHIYRVL